LLLSVSQETDIAMREYHTADNGRPCDAMIEHGRRRLAMAKQ
jgi:hypothetical protein